MAVNGNSSCYIFMYISHSFELESSVISGFVNKDNEYMYIYAMAIHPVQGCAAIAF